MSQFKSILLLFAITFSHYAYTQSFEWSIANNGQNFDEGVDIKRDSLGFLYVIGTFKDTLQLDNITLTTDGQMMHSTLNMTL